MAQAPESYQRPPHEGEDISRHRADEPHGQRGGGGLYQSYRYQKFRGHVKRRRRAMDEDRVHGLYLELHPRSFADYIAWLHQDNPLCVDCLANGLIKAGRVMDHKKPIEKGGSVWAKDNLQFLCDTCHNQKRATEDRTS